jgi:hypothetical protein
MDGSFTNVATVSTALGETFTSNNTATLSFVVGIPTPTMSNAALLMLVLSVFGIGTLGLAWRSRNN